MSPERVKNWIAPERTWLSMSVSPPSTLLGKIRMVTRPSVPLAIRAAAALARTFIGWASGRLFAYLKMRPAASARRTKTSGRLAAAASAVRRAIGFFRMLPPVAAGAGRPRRGAT